MKIYKYLDYRDWTKDQMTERNWSSKQLAESAGINVSYFSRVMQKKASFSKDQLFEIGSNTDLSPIELDFLLLLGEHDEAANFRLKRHLLNKIVSISETQLKLSESLKQLDLKVSEPTAGYDQYYLNPLTAQIHMLLTIDRFNQNTDHIATELGISVSRLNQEFEILSRLGIIKKSKDKVKVLSDSIHLDESMPISKVNLVNRRLQSINHIQRADRQPTDYFFSVTFSADESVKAQLKARFKEFIVGAQTLVGDSPTIKNVYQLNFDLF